MSSNKSPAILPLGNRRPQAQWNSDQTDLSALRLTPEELARKLASRQSQNIAIARATLLSAGANNSQPLTPALAARLRAATEQSVESVLAECNAAMNNSQRIRQGLTSPSTASESTCSPVAFPNSDLSAPGDLADDEDQEGGHDLQQQELSGHTMGNGNPTATAENAARTSTPSSVPQTSSEATSSSAPEKSISYSVASSNSAQVNNSTGPSLKYGTNKYPLVTTNGSGNSSTYSSISSLLRSKHTKSDASDYKNVKGVRAGLASYRSDITSPASKSDSGMSYSTSLSDIQYTKDPEEARLEHEKELERLKEDCQVDSPPIENLQEVLKISSQDQLTNRNLDKTLELVVSTCEALWAQLQQERQTRQQLQEHLQRQGAVIGDLTSELLQIQEQQEDILQEVQLARSSLLWQMAAGGEEVGQEAGPPQSLRLAAAVRGAGGGLGRAGLLFGAPPSVSSLLPGEDRRLSSSAPPSFYPPGSSLPPPYGSLPPGPAPGFPSAVSTASGGASLHAAHALLGRRFQPHSLHNSPKHHSPFLPPHHGGKDNFS